MDRHLRITIFLILLLGAFSHYCFAADTNWLTTTDAGLKPAAEAYLKAAEPVGKLPFDLSYVMLLLERGEFGDKAFDILDEAMKRERVLENGWKSIQNVTGKPDAAESDYNFLKCRLRLIVAVARAGVAQRMADPAMRAYSSQAMESAIDALRDSANYGEKAKDCSPGLGAPNPSPAKISALRTKLLEIWDASQKRADATPIREMDLSALVKSFQ